MKTTEQTTSTYGNAWIINVDVQNDFALPTGALSVADGESIVSPLNQINRWAREQGGTIVFTGDQHPPHTAHFIEHGGPWPTHCVAGTAGAELHEALEVCPWDTIADKGQSVYDDGYSGMDAIPVAGALADPELDGKNHTLSDELGELEIIYRQRRSRLAVLVGGLATDYCVKATVLDALERTDRQVVDVVLLRDAVRAVNLQPHDGDAAIQAMLEAGALAMTTEEAMAGGITIDRTRLEC